MANVDYGQFVLNAPFGWAYCSLILDKTGQPSDARILENNQKFCLYTSLPPQALSGKRLKMVLPEIAAFAGDFWPKLAESAESASPAEAVSWQFFSETRNGMVSLQVQRDGQDGLSIVMNPLGSSDNLAHIKA